MRPGHDRCSVDVPRGMTSPVYGQCMRPATKERGDRPVCTNHAQAFDRGAYLCWVVQS